MKTERIRPWRLFAEVAQALIITGLPFLTIKGESALRFDISTLRLHFFGASIWMEEFFLVFAALIFITLFALFITMLFGRIWCGWGCPQTVLIDLTPFMDKAKTKGLPYKLAAWSAVFLISALIAANLIWYFVSPYDFIPRSLEGRLGSVEWGFWIVMTGILFLNFALVRHKFCATVCPYAKIQSVICDNRTLVIAFDNLRKDECMKCMACVRTCPVGIDIREGFNASCINCAECVDACSEMMEHKGKKSLVGYFFGRSGETGRILRQNALMTGALTAAAFCFLMYLVFTRPPYDFIVLPNYAFPPRISADGSAISSYLLSITNRERADVELRIEGKLMSALVKVNPERILLEAGEMRKVPVYVAIRNYDKSRITGHIDISIESDKPDMVRVTRQANLVLPESGSPLP